MRKPLFRTYFRLAFGAANCGYTAIVRGNNKTIGDALVEVYELP
jgi:hypothetical protein